MKTRVDKENLARLAEEGKTLKEAAAFFGIPPGSMGYWTKKYRVSFRSQSAASFDREDVKRGIRAAQLEPLNNLYKQVAEVRMTMRRLAHKERKLLDQITTFLDGGIDDGSTGESAKPRANTAN